MESTREMLLYFSLSAMERQGRGGQVEELPCRKRRDAVVFLPFRPRGRGKGFRWRSYRVVRGEMLLHY